MLYVREATHTTFVSVIFGHSSQAENWVGYFSLASRLYYCSLSFSRLPSPSNYLSLQTWKNASAFFPQQVSEKKNFIIIYFSSDSANIKSASLKVDHFCLPCVFSAVLEFFVFLSLVLEVTSGVISEMLFMIHFSNLLRKVMSSWVRHALEKGISR